MATSDTAKRPFHGQKAPPTSKKGEKEAVKDEKQAEVTTSDIELEETAPNRV